MTQNVADDKDYALKTRGINGVELHYIHSSLSLSNSKNLLSQNKPDHIQRNRFHCLSTFLRREAL